MLQTSVFFGLPLFETTVTKKSMQYRNTRKFMKSGLHEEIWYTEVN